MRAFLQLAIVLLALPAWAGSDVLENLQVVIEEARQTLFELQQRLPKIADPKEKSETESHIEFLLERQREAKARVKELQSHLDISKPCPVCGGKLTRISQVHWDSSQPSKNIDIWNRSMCANLLFRNTSPVCTICWFAQYFESGGWTRTSHDKYSFFRPLPPAITGFPLPRAFPARLLPIYSQFFKGLDVEHTLYFWCAASELNLGEMREYCHKHGLFLKTTIQPTVPGETYVSISTKAPPDGE